MVAEIWFNKKRSFDILNSRLLQKDSSNLLVDGSENLEDDESLQCKADNDPLIDFSDNIVQVTQQLFMIYIFWFSLLYLSSSLYPILWQLF